MRIATLMWNRSSLPHIARALFAQGIEVEGFAAASALIAAHATHPFEAILIEDSAPLIGERLAKLQPHLAAQTTIIVVGEGGAANISRALLHGADDYAISCELASIHLVQRAIARVSVKMRASQKSTLKVGPYTLDLKNGALQSQVLQVRLTSRELALGRQLFEQCNQLVPIEQLCRALSDRVDDSAERAVQQHVYELRRKLQRVVPPNGEALRVETVYGKGYRLAW